MLLPCKTKQNKTKTKKNKAKKTDKGKIHSTSTIVSL